MNMDPVRRMNEFGSEYGDGVYAETHAIATHFVQEGDELIPKPSEPIGCRVMCSREDGIVSFSMMEINFMFTVSVYDMFEILAEAAAANREYLDSMKKLSKGAGRDGASESQSN